MQKTKIEWCDRTWNPVTGCLYGCEYCYARRIAQRFGGTEVNQRPKRFMQPKLAELNAPLHRIRRDGKKVESPFPYFFSPTFHRYRLEEPAKLKNPQTIFVCSMGDLFGDWVPDQWIKEVMEATLKAPQHTYLFLTKNPGRYIRLIEAGVIPSWDNYWLGSTITDEETPYFYSKNHKTFLSVEPILAPFSKREKVERFTAADWIILGAMTGPGSKRNQPKMEWVEVLVESARDQHIPVFMKDSLRSVWGPELIQEFPKEMER